MMYCSYHAKNPAVVQCNQCARWLCPACDHRVRGFPFCQDCIVAGVELLRYNSNANPSSILRRKSSPFIATLLSFVPGLGAAYNGQTSKAIVHFAIFASFFQMAVLTQGGLLVNPVSHPHITDSYLPHRLLDGCRRHPSSIARFRAGSEGISYKCPLCGSFPQC